jgi:hypothetical protein
MGREGDQMKRKRRDLTNKTRGPCNFCEFSSSRYGCSSEDKLQEQDNEAVLRKEVERLRLLIKRMTGKEDIVSFTELLALQSHLMDVRSIVLEQKKEVELEEAERPHKQKKEAEHDADGMRRGVLVPCKFSASSLGERQEDPNGEAPLVRVYSLLFLISFLSSDCVFKILIFLQLQMQREFEQRSSESLQSEFDKLWLFNE